MVRRSRLNRRVILFSSIAILVALSACSTGTSSRELADQEVSHFHEKLNNGEFESIVLNGSEEIQSPAMGMVAYLKKVHEVAGNVQSSKEVTDSLQRMGGEAMITMVYLTRFEQGGATETFVFRTKNGRPKLMSYDLKGFRELNRD